MKLWQIVTSDEKSWDGLPPSDGYLFVRGFVYGHPHKREGAPIQTSNILGFNSNTFQIVCASRAYELECIEPQYKQLFAAYVLLLLRYLPDLAGREDEASAVHKLMAAPNN